MQIFISGIAELIGKLVRATGLEPVRTKARDFKSRVATNYTTPALFYSYLSGLS